MKQRKIPMRKCTGCLEMKHKKDLIRIVRLEENTSSKFVLDFTGKQSGRGAYICPNMACLEKACKQKGLERSFKQAVPSKVYDQLRGELTKNGS